MIRRDQTIKYLGAAIDKEFSWNALLNNVQEENLDDNQQIEIEYVKETRGGGAEAQHVK